MRRPINVFITRLKKVVKHAHKGLALLLITLLFSFNLIASAFAAGELDPTFGAGGKVITDFGSFDDEANAVAVQTDGKVVIAGTAFRATPSSDFGVARYNTDGSLDTSFGIGGKVITDFGGTEDVFAIAIQSDGKIVVAGDANLKFALARYNANGSLDATFGSGGKVTTIITGIFTQVFALAIQTDGKIIAAGTALGLPTLLDFAVARYNPDGSLDSTFGIGGKLTTDFNSNSIDEAFGVAIQSDGKIVTAGWASDGTSNGPVDFALARYNVDGSLDSTFGIGGKLTTDFGSLDDEAHALRIQTDGKIVAAGSTRSGNGDFALARYNLNGSLDATFGSGGKVTTDFGNFDQALALAIESDGKLVAGGFAYNARNGDFAVAEYNMDGSLNMSFGTGGKTTSDFFNNTDAGTALAIQPDGKIVVAGLSFTGTGFDFALARYDGLRFDLCLQDDGSGNHLQINSATGNYLFSNCRGQVIGGVGTISKRGSIITLQHYASDRRVTARIDQSSQTATSSVQLLSQGSTFTIMDRNIMNNSCTCP